MGYLARNVVALLVTLFAGAAFAQSIGGNGGGGSGGGGTGDVVGPASTTDNCVARYDGTTGKLIQNSTACIDDTGVLTSVGLVTAGATTDLTTIGNEDITLNAAGTGLTVVSDTLSLPTAGIIRTPSLTIQDATPTTMVSIAAGGFMSVAGAYNCISTAASCVYQSSASNSGNNLTLRSAANSSGETAVWAGSTSNTTGQIDFAVGHNNQSTTVFTVSGLGDTTTTRGFQPIRSTLATCAAAFEGQLQNDVLSGLATGARTRLCLCTSAGASDFAWQNVVTGTVGTTTTCAP